MTKHTLGPWRYLDGAILSEKLNDYGNWHIARIQKGETMTPQDLANARLIAAAPDLLTACKRALVTLKDEYPESLWPEYGAINALEEAIKKAKGSA